MRVLWFEVYRPLRYKKGLRVTGGWQDSLEEYLVNVPGVELIVAFEGEEDDSEVRSVDGITYVPIHLKNSRWDRLSLMWDWEGLAKKLIPEMVSIVDSYKPDIIHVFGTEWPFGLISEYVNIPVVIHIQGAVIPMNNALYPPGYSRFSFAKMVPVRYIRTKFFYFLEAWKKNDSRAKIEKRIWKAASNYMGRTEWDKSLSSILHPGRRYFHVEEALRPSFSGPDAPSWNPSPDGKTHILTIGCYSLLKGPDLLLKTAHVLMECGFDFEWSVAGQMPPLLKEFVEAHEKMRFAENHVCFIGHMEPDQLAERLSGSTLYVHTSYLENSPNSICEAQVIGVPVVATNVGGVSSLVENGKDGVLVPANDPWQMAAAIMKLAVDSRQLMEYSANARKRAIARHAKENVVEQLLACYSSLAEKN